MRIVCNRFNAQRTIELVKPYGANMSMESRWQLTFMDKRGRHYDHFLVAKPTRKQIRNLSKGK